jgi:hypothetical protein
VDRDESGVHFAAFLQVLRKSGTHALPVKNAKKKTIQHRSGEEVKRGNLRSFD